MATNANGRRRRQLMARRLTVAPLTMAATLLGMSEMALAGAGAAETAPAQSGSGVSQALLKKMDAMEQLRQGARHLPVVDQPVHGLGVGGP